MENNRESDRTFIVGGDPQAQQSTHGESALSWDPTWLSSGVSAPSFGPDAPVTRSGGVSAPPFAPDACMTGFSGVSAQSVGPDARVRTHSGGVSAQSVGPAARMRTRAGGVSVPSFGLTPSAPVIRSGVVGRGRASLLLSLVEDTPQSHVPPVRQQAAHSTMREGQPNVNTNVYDQQESESSSDDEAMERLREHQGKWSEQMSYMDEQRKHLEMAMSQLMAKKEEKMKLKEQSAAHARHATIGDSEGRARPVLSSTQDVADSGDGSSLSSAHGGREARGALADPNFSYVSPVNRHEYGNMVTFQSQVHHQPAASQSYNRHEHAHTKQTQYIPYHTAVPQNHSAVAAAGVAAPHPGVAAPHPAVAVPHPAAVAPPHPTVAAPHFGVSTPHQTVANVVHGKSWSDSSMSAQGYSTQPAPVIQHLPQHAADTSNVSLGELRSAMQRVLKFKSFGTGKDRLDYLQAEKQIRRAEKKGYEPYEIIDAVVEALPAGSEFRSVLLLKSNNLNVAELLDLLHSEYLEVENSDLLTQLTTAEQTTKEDEMAFLNRLIKLKERILYEGRLKISSETLMEMVLKSLESGLQNERIVTRLLPLFSQQNVNDAVLKQEMSKAMRSCTLRKDKKHQNARIAAVEDAAKKSKEDELIKMAKVLHEDVAEVKQVTQRLVSTPNQFQQQTFQRKPFYQ